MVTLVDVLPDAQRAEVVVPAPHPGPGNWSGAPSAVHVDGVIYLAYRVRQPITEGRGVAVAIARSQDGVTFELLAEVRRELFGAESLERPALVPLPDGSWRLYVSCATPGSKHWWIEAVDAPTPEGLGRGRRTVVLPGDRAWGVKDPVVRLRDGADMPTLDDVRAHLRAVGLATQKWPEQLPKQEQESAPAQEAAETE